MLVQWFDSGAEILAALLEIDINQKAYLLLQLNKPKLNTDLPAGLGRPEPKIEQKFMQKCSFP